jgi:hypothetical protein
MRLCPEFQEMMAINDVDSSTKITSLDEATEAETENVEQQETTETSNTEPECSNVSIQRYKISHTHQNKKKNM